MLTSATPFPIGTAIASAKGTAYASMLGTRWTTPDGKIYRLCQVGASDITTAAGRGVVTAYSAGVPSWIVSFAGAVTTQDIVVIPAGQTGSGATSTTLVAGDYFFALVQGPATLLATNTTMVRVTANSLTEFLQVNSLGTFAAFTESRTPAARIQATNTVAATAAGLGVTAIVSTLL